MKVVVINYTGTVGKTTVSAHLLAPRMKDAPLYAIETINQAADELGVDVEKIRGENFRELFAKLLGEDQAIIDVGASNVEAFMQNLESFEQAHEEFDYFVIPVTSGTKEQKETIIMIDSLLALGVPGEKIRILFNRVQRDVKSEFMIVCGYHELQRSFWMDPECAVYESELFDAVSMHHTSIEQLLNDDIDYKKKMKDKDLSTYERAKLADLFGLKLLAKGVNRKLDRAFALLLDQEAKTYE